jgi:hypothetical protein
LRQIDVLIYTNVEMHYFQQDYEYAYTPFNMNCMIYMASYGSKWSYRLW